MKRALGDIADIRNGYAFRGRVVDDPDGDVTVLTIKDIKPDAAPDESELTRIPSAGLNRLERYLLEDGDVVFQSRGYRHNAMVFAGPVPAIAAQGLYQIRPNEAEVAGAYLAWYLNHENYQRQLLNSAQGTQIQLIPRRELAALKVAVPPLEVQAQIVDLAELRQRQKQAQAALDHATDELISGICWQKTKQD